MPAPPGTVFQERRRTLWAGGVASAYDLGATLSGDERMHLSDRDPHRSADVHDAELALGDEVVKRGSSDAEQRGGVGDTQEQRLSSSVVLAFV
jgi:hypothetical protein